MTLSGGQKSATKLIDAKRILLGGQNACHSRRPIVAGAKSPLVVADERSPQKVEETATKK